MECSEEKNELWELRVRIEAFIRLVVINDSISEEIADEALLLSDKLAGIHEKHLCRIGRVA